MSYADRTTLNNLTPNLDIGDVADPALRLAAFQYLYNLSDENYAYLQSLVTSGTLSPLPPDFMGRQAMINGNLDVWQRGTSSTNPAFGSYLADRFFVSFLADGGTLPTNIVHSRVELTPSELSGSFYYYRISPDGAGSAFGANASYGIFQRIENATRYLCGSGKKLTISFWARSSIGSKRIGLSFSQRYGTGGSPTSAENITGQIITLTPAWTKYTVTISTNTLSGKTFGTNNDDYFQTGFYHMWGTTTATNSFGGGTAESFVGAGNIDIAQVQVCAGDVALPFQPRGFADELALCQRYYEKSYKYVDAPGTATSNAAYWLNAAATTPIVTIPFRTRKRSAAPTMTYYSTNGAAGKALNYTGAVDITASTLSIGDTVAVISFGTVAVGNQIAVHCTADAEL